MLKIDSSIWLKMGIKMNTPEELYANLPRVSPLAAKVARALTPSELSWAIGAGAIEGACSTRLQTRLSGGGADASLAGLFAVSRSSSGSSAAVRLASVAGALVAAPAGLALCSDHAGLEGRSQFIRHRTLQQQRARGRAGR